VDHVREAVAARTERVGTAVLPSTPVPDTVQGALVLDPRANDAFTAVNRLLKADVSVLRATTGLELGGGTRWPAGAFVIPVQEGIRARVADAVQSLGLSVRLADRTPAAAVALKAPRVAIYHAWGGNMDEGWTRWVLEQFEFSYTRLHDADVRAGDLAARFDVILLPDATYQQMLSGFARGAMPEEYTGGMTAGGVQALRTFTERGGVLVAMDRAAELPLTGFGLPIRNVTARQRDTDFFIPGALLRVQVDPSHPVAFGMPEQAAAVFINSPAFAAEAPGLSARVVARYPSKDILMSGWVLGERLITDRAAVMDIRLGRGRIVLLGFRTGHRGQPHGTFKLLFNSLFLFLTPG
jgi:hypothetical protein